MLIAIVNKIEKAPHEPGVYIFYGKNKKSLYIGKASDLRTRLRNYLKISDYKTELLAKEARNLKLIVLRSEIEALLEESRLIKTLKPRYNIIWRDDKSYFYVAITKERFPKIFITHRHLKTKSSKLKTDYIGPFTEGRPLRSALKLLRRHFPYCTCLAPHLRRCLNAEIDNCLGFCCRKNIAPTENEIKKYKKNIRVIRSFLLGESRKMAFKNLSSEERQAVENILAHREFLEEIAEHQRPDVDGRMPQISRAECYDISHLAGKEAVGAMTAWLEVSGTWIADKNLWRKFKIRSAPPSDDPAAMKEVVTRRLNHPEWRYPDLIIIDGGITQLRAAQKALETLKAKSYKLKTMKVISFAKPQKTVWGWANAKETPLASLPENIQKLILKAIAGTHKFAITYHRNLRRRMFLKL